MLDRSFVDHPPTSYGVDTLHRYVVCVPDMSGKKVLESFPSTRFVFPEHSF